MATGPAVSCASRSATPFVGGAVAVALALAVLPGGVACTPDAERPEGGLVELVDDTPASSDPWATPTAVAATRIYFEHPNQALCTNEAPEFFGVFDVLPGATVDLQMQVPDGGDRRMRLVVHRVTRAGNLRELGRVGAARQLPLRLTSAHGGTYVVEAAGQWQHTWGASFELTLRCTSADGRCSPEGQPGDGCGTDSVGGCDEGLYCAQDEGCGADGAAGRCRVQATVCAMDCPGVCGCDGRTWCNRCEAAAAGVSVVSDGACECDPKRFDLLSQAPQHALLGTWRFAVHATEVGGTHHGRGTLTLMPGRYSYSQVWEPWCAEDPMLCDGEVIQHDSEGGWENLGFAVQLRPDPTKPGVAEALGRVFFVEENCRGEVRLFTTEQGVTRVFTTDDPSDG